MNRLREGLLARKDFVVTCELVPGRGHAGVGIDAILKFAEEARNSPYVHALSVTDNAGGNPALLADVLGPEMQKMGHELLVHFSCKDLNRNMIEARGYALQRAGIRNLLVVTGDYPISGFFGLAKPVFDIDSVNALDYLKQMNEGLEVTNGRRREKLEPTEFFLGAVVSPFKSSEASAVMQYVKLEKKLRAGADFIITQLGYDARKFAELVGYVREHLRSEVPLMGSVYVLSAGAARFMARGEVPGCYVHPRLVSVLEEEAAAPDKGRQARLERAARQIAILKGLGYDGAHLEGLNLKFADVREIMERAAAIAENWRDHLREFDYSPQDAHFLFAGGEELAGLPAMLVRRETPKRRVASPKFWLMRAAHKLLFIEGTPGYGLMKALSRWAERRRPRYRFFQVLEHTSKRALFDCRECDDCALFETYYLCPESRCPKGQRIGPCGGSRVDGSCEVFADRPCLWELVYWRAKRLSELDKLDYIINPRDWRLYETSSWINYFLGRDHRAVRTTIPPRPRSVTPAEGKR